MKIIRTSEISGVTRTIDLPVTQEQMDRFFSRTETIQDIFPNLSAAEREFIKSGITPDEWDDIFSLPAGNNYETYA